MKWAGLVIRTVIVVAVLVGVAIEFGYFDNRRLAARVNELEEEKNRLAEFARRLQSSRRVAQLDVIKQTKDAQGRSVLLLLWQEIGEDGSLGRPLALEAIGTQVYIEGMVLKFDPARLQEGDGRSGVSVVMFRRIFGDQQTPNSALELDRTAGPPNRDSTSSDDRIATQRLWERFWELTENARLAHQLGVRVAQCEAPSVRMRTGQVWEVSLDAAGGLNLRKISDRPVEQAVSLP